MFRKFRFEETIYSDLSDIPMSTRFKLDRVGIQLDAKTWSHFSLEERRVLCHLSVRSQGELGCYRDFLLFLLRKHKEKAEKRDPESTRQERSEWENLSRIPEMVYFRILKLKKLITPQEWIDLDDLERYVLFKLSQDKRNDEVFAQAFEEFLPLTGLKAQRIS
ncbi:MAG TPA: nitrate reductase associated protein [bacterium]|nr:nitrate reductase associated protein [bacterium]